MTLKQLNQADCATFTNSVGFAFENSPWIAEAAWQRRPFRDVSDLHARMVAVVEAAPVAEKIALIAAHPDLAGRVANEGRLTPASQEEQDAAGLAQLTPAEIARFESLNKAYRARFGFPFVICARENTKNSIIAALERRARGDRDSEIAIALQEIAKIARLRLQTAVQNG